MFNLWNIQNDFVPENELLKVEKWMSKNPYCLKSDTTVINAANTLRRLNTDYIPIVSDDRIPLGVVTTNMVLEQLVQNHNGMLSLKVERDNFSTLSPADSLFDLYALSNDYFMVVDSQNKLIGTLTSNDISRGLFSYIQEIDRREHTSEILKIVLERAYEGVAVVDKNEIIVEINDAYCRFMGVVKEDVVGCNVQEVIDNTNLHNTIKTGIPERGMIQYINGQAMIVHRIPLWRNDQVVGAIGMVIFEGVTELYNIYERLQRRNGGHLKTGQSLSGKTNNKGDVVSLDQIIGRSSSTSNLKSMARKVAKTNATILITGESGTGKELYAQSIHRLSPFSNGHFISLNCGAIPAQLFESELFGYEEGAFTGAKKGGKPGKFELAQNGTLFLDEIGEMPLLMQTKLLRVLQEKKFERIGGIEKHEMNVRIIAATNKNLKEMVAAGNFREDLYYRINVIELSLEPLRNRPEDIPPLVSHYLYTIALKYHIKQKKLTAEAVSALMHYPWYGNIRELENVIERLIILVDNHTIELKHLPAYIKNTRYDEIKNSDTGNKTLLHHLKSDNQRNEMEIIQSILRKNDGNKTKAAKELGIHRTTLYQKMKKYSI